MMILNKDLTSEQWDGSDDERAKILKGIKLPKTKEQWDMANDYSKCTLPFNVNVENIERSTGHPQNTVYQYFKINFGNDVDKAAVLYEKYGSLSKNKLKNAEK